jgi:hypothetical protein
MKDPIRHVHLGPKEGTPMCYCHYCMSDFPKERHYNQGQLKSGYTRFSYDTMHDCELVGWVAITYKGQRVDRPVLLCSKCAAFHNVGSRAEYTYAHAKTMWLHHLMSEEGLY